MQKDNLQEDWDEYYPKVYGYFFRRIDSKADVEDLTSIVLEQFLRAVYDEHRKDKIENKHAFLWKIAYNQLCSFIKRKSKDMLVVGIESVPGWEPEDKSAEEKRGDYFEDRIAKLLECIKNQTKDQDFTIINACLIEDRKSEEVAKMLNLTAQNVRQRLSRSLQKVREKCKGLWV